MSAHILVVDDDINIRAMVSLALADEGYEVVTAANGAEALREIEQHRPTAMLLDMQMPVLDGWGVAQGMRERGCWVPTVVMTAATSAAERCRQIGADACLPKPFSLDDLYSTIARVRRH